MKIQIVDCVGKPGVKTMGLGEIERDILLQNTAEPSVFAYYNGIDDFIVLADSISVIPVDCYRDYLSNMDIEDCWIPTDFNLRINIIRP